MNKKDLLDIAAKKCGEESGYVTGYHKNKVEEAFKAGAEWAMERLKHIPLDVAMNEIMGVRRYENEPIEEED